MSITTQIHVDLLTWFQDLPVWQNEAFRRIMAKAKPDAQDLAELVDLALEESGLQTKRAAFPSQLTNTDLPTAPIATGVTPPRLLALHALENVNSLMPGQRLNFGASGLTVIYGGNGAGKSGYARVLKKACRCNERAIEPVLRNIYQATTGSVTAKLDIDSSGTTETLIWSDGAKADERLRHFAVFDSKAARLFVSDKNEVPSPSVFVKLETLGDATKHVRERLARMATDAQPQADALRTFIDDTVTGKLIGQINASTSVKALGDALVWCEADDARLLDLEKQSSTLKVSGPQVLRKQLQQRLARVRILRSEMEKVEKALAADKVSSLQAQAKLCNELKAAKSLAAEKALGLTEREILLQTILGEAKKSEAAGEPEEFAARAFRFYGLLRSTWERAVEELMFNKVVQRFEKNVATRSLTGAVVDEEAIKLVFAAMTKCSGLIDGHDHAIALNSETPDCDEMKIDLDALCKFRTEMTKKRNDQEKLLAHLK